MTEAEWLARLDAFMAIEQPTSADLADVFGAMAERFTRVVASYANRQHDELQAFARRLDEFAARLRALEQRDDEQARSFGESADGNGPD